MDFAGVMDGDVKIVDAVETVLNFFIKQNLSKIFLSFT